MAFGGPFQDLEYIFLGLAVGGGGESLEFSGFCDGFCPFSKVLLVNSGDFPPFSGGGSLFRAIFEGKIFTFPGGAGLTGDSVV